MWFLVAWKWVKNNIWPTIAAFGSGLVVIFGIAFFFQRKKARSASDDLKVANIKTKVEALKVRAKVLGEQNERDEKEVLELMGSRQKLKLEIVEARNTVGMTNQEVMDAFSALGY